MDNQSLYDLSMRANEIIAAARSLLGLHLVRYSHFVNTSPKGFSCTYAMITAREFHQPEELSDSIKQLQELRDTCDDILSELSAASPRQEPVLPD